jgi:protein-S-isoprenylcysteine O-methyltransferase Ste14
VSRNAWIAKIAAGVVVNALFLAAFFWIAGDFGWGRGWAFVGVAVTGMGANALYLWRTNPEVLVHRARLGEGTKRWDVVLLTLFGLAYAGVLLLAPLDARYGWSDVPLALWPLGAAFFLSGIFVGGWAMRENRHFEKSVRIQTDRGHTVVNTGPYRLVRHPGYVGAILSFLLAPPLMLGSWWAFVPAAAAALVLVVRTVLEDRLLRAELEGYADYASRVRYRLVPGLW